MTNISSEYVDFSRKCIFDYLKQSMDKMFDKNIANGFIDKYISIRYYNLEVSIYNNLARDIDYYLKEHMNNLLEDNSNNKIECVKNTYLMFKYILYFDDVLSYTSVLDIVSQLEDFRSKRMNIYDDAFLDDFTLLVKANNKRKKTFLSSFESDKFIVSYIDTNKRNVFLTRLDYNFNFPKIYSKYSKNKVYNTGIINEDKLMVLYNLLNLKVLNNIIRGEYDKKYIVDFPVSIFSKVEKINRLLNIVDEDCVRDNIIIKISYSDYLEHKDKVDELIKNGNRFCIYIDDKFDYRDESKIWLDVFTYILIDKEKLINFDNQELIIFEK